MKLIDQNCKPVQAGTQPLSNAEAGSLLLQVPSWSLAAREITREFRFKDFRQTMDFVNKVAAIADGQDHHPDMFISYNKVKLTLSTHKINGLSMNDFILAAKIDLLTLQEPGEKAA